MNEPILPDPPRWALRLLRWYCKPRYHEAIEGDLYELFDDRVARLGVKRARQLFSWDVIRFMRLRYIKGLENSKGLNQIDMWKNYFKISVRSLWRHRFYTFINIIGLSVGVACCVLILLFIQHDLSYDKFYADHDRIFRVALNGRGHTPARLGKQFKEDYPQVESYTRINGLSPATFVVGEKVISEAGGAMVDSTIFEVFDMKFLEGTPRSALIEPNSIVLTRSLAEKYFPGESALGKIVRSSGESAKVTAVVADPPSNTHFPFRYLIAMSREEWATKGWWTGNNFYTYVKLQNPGQRSSLEAQMPAFVEKYIGPELIAFSGHATFAEYLEAGNERFFTFLPLADIHLHHPRFSLGKGGDINNVYIFSSVAFFILLIACINFINLTTAKSANRSKEVGMRKVLGAGRSELIQQFLVESVIVSLGSIVLAVGLAWLILPYFNDLSGKTFSGSELWAPESLLYLTFLFLAISLLAGSYPAFHISAFKPVKALKGEIRGSRSSAFLRKGLVSFQFGVSILLVIATLAVYVQLNYLSEQELGMETAQVLAVRGGNAVGEKAGIFKDQLLTNPHISAIGISNAYPSQPHYDWNYKTIEDNPVTFGFSNLFTDTHYQETLGIELVAGRYFDETRASDTASIVLNEAAVRELGWDNPVGQKLSRGDGEDYTVIGVLKDYNYYSLKNKIRGLVIRYDPGLHLKYSTFLIKINSNYHQTVEEIKEVWAGVVPEQPIDYIFLDDAFARLYESEQRFGKVFTSFSVLAISIACLGLFALAAFTLEKRFKEIAIRRVLGAGIFTITRLVLTDFTRLVLIGAIVAVPLAFYFVEMWLENFAYRMKLNIFLFLIPVAAVVLIAWLTVTFQSIKTASSNPVKALKQE